MTFIVFLLSALTFAQEAPPKEVLDVPSADIIVEAHKDYEVYIAPVSYRAVEQTYSISIPEHMVFNYASMHSNYAKVRVGLQRWQQVTTRGGIKVYNKDTIKYIRNNCKYNRDYRQCSFQNNHYFVETIISINKNEANISMTLFDPSMQAISSSNISDKAIIRWIKQQEITVTQQQGMMGSTTTIHKPKEELPLEWRIPPDLFVNAIRQASLRLWTGVKLD